MQTLPAKTPGQRLDYGWNVPVDDGDTITSATVTVQSGDIMIDSRDVDTANNRLSFVLSGGTPGQNKLYVVANTAGGDIFDDVFNILVRSEFPVVPITGIYGSAAGFRAYHTARDHSMPDEALDDDTVNSWLLKASEWIDGTYRAGFGGRKVGMRAQVREWPRNAAYDIYGYMIVQASVPPEVEYATYEAALRQGTNPGSLLVDYTPNKYKAVSIDGAVSATYAGFNSGSDAQTQFLAIDQILFPIMTANGASSSLSGSVGRV